ncbi:MAG: hypothetical protein NVSMB6_16050 [Burkholderiaceae bacterium]
MSESLVTNQNQIPSSQNNGPGDDDDMLHFDYLNEIGRFQIPAETKLAGGVPLPTD